MRGSVWPRGGVTSMRVHMNCPLSIFQKGIPQIFPFRQTHFHQSAKKKNTRGKKKVSENPKKHNHVPSLISVMDMNDANQTLPPAPPFRGRIDGNFGEIEGKLTPRPKVSQSITECHMSMQTFPKD